MSYRDEFAAACAKKLDAKPDDKKPGDEPGKPEEPPTDEVCPKCGRPLDDDKDDDPPDGEDEAGADVCSRCGKALPTEKETDPEDEEDDGLANHPCRASDRVAKALARPDRTPTRKASLRELRELFGRKTARGFFRSGLTQKTALRLQAKMKADRLKAKKRR